MSQKGVVHVFPLIVVAIFLIGTLVATGAIKVTPSISPSPSPESSVEPSPSVLPSPVVSPTPSPTPIPPTPTSTPIPASTPTPTLTVNNAPPGAGYSRQSVSTEIGVYTISLVAGDISSTRVIVDTASPGDCFDDCPALSLGDYVARNGAYAGINGSYFCPADYASCTDKSNSFDTLLMNKDKVYFNSANNIYSTVPAVIFGQGYIRFVGASSEWGRDTGINSMIANQPLLLAGGNITFGGDGDPKKGSKAGRSFVATKGNTVYIGVVHSATVAESAIVLKALGMENALNLDSGGSTALWSGGYKVGPGRAIPNAILFVQQ